MNWPFHHWFLFADWIISGDMSGAVAAGAGGGTNNNVAPPASSKHIHLAPLILSSVHMRKVGRIV